MTYHPALRCCCALVYDFVLSLPPAQKGGTTGLFGSTAVVLRAAKDYEAGEEFLVSYGPKGAAGYLEENGYVLVGHDNWLIAVAVREAYGLTITQVVSEFYVH